MADEKRLIDANATIDAFTNWLTSRYDGRLPRDIVAELPTVDAVEVVRCKSCKHWADGVAGCTEHVKCCKIGFYMIGEDGYCSFGERK